MFKPFELAYYINYADDLNYYEQSVTETIFAFLACNMKIRNQSTATILSAFLLWLCWSTENFIQTRGLFEAFSMANCINLQVIGIYSAFLSY